MWVSVGAAQGGWVGYVCVFNGQLGVMCVHDWTGGGYMCDGWVGCMCVRDWNGGYMCVSV